MLSDVFTEIEGVFMAKLMPHKATDTPRKPPHISTDDVRGGSTPHIVRYVLGFGLVLAILAMSAAWIIPALTR
jgi:hypothetical protein